MPTADSPLLHACALTRDFGPKRALDHLDLTLNTGEILGLLGANGAGKTTTLRMLTGALAPTRGAVHICGHDLRVRPLAAKRCIGSLPEHPPLYPELTVNEYLHFCTRLHHIPRKKRAAAVAAAQTDCGLSDVGKRLIGNLSKGYQQRVGIAQAIVHRPRIVILDEPTAGLDPHQIRQIRTLITRLADTHGVILSSHILPEIQAIASRVMLLHQGRVALDASMAELDLRAGGNIRLGLTHGPDPAALASITGVGSAEFIGNGQWRITTTAGTDPAEALASAAIHNDWGLFELSREQHTLEELFVQLTAHDDASDAAA